jgi:hypothetical protein
MSFAEELRDHLIAWWCAQEILLAEEGMKKTHKQFNTRLGFPVVLCCPHRMALTDQHIAGWHKTAPMTNVLKDVTCQNCIKELEKLL